MLPRRKANSGQSTVLLDTAAVWQAATGANGGMPPLCQSCDNLPAQGVFNELFLGIRTVPDVPLTG